MKILFRLLVLSAFFWLTATLQPLRAQHNVINSVFGKGIRAVAADSSFYMKFGLRFSTLYEGFLNTRTRAYNDNLLTRRFRLKFDGYALTPRLVYKVELGISNRDIGGVSPETNGASRIILDAVLKWNFAPNFYLWFGQTKLPGNRERVVSSQKLQFVDRSILNSRFNIDRDLGLQLHHHHRVGRAVLREIVSVSKGEGRNVTIKNKQGYDITGRIEVLPFGLFAKKGDYFQVDLVREPTPKLAIGITYDYNAGAVRSNAQLGPWLDEPRDLEMIMIDGAFKYRGFSAMSEYANRVAKGGAVVATDPVTGEVTQAFYTGEAFVAQAGYLFKNNYEVALRYAFVNQDPETQRGDIDQYTIGFSKYIVGHSLKAQTDLTYIRQVGRDEVLMFRFQVEVAF